MARNCVICGKPHSFAWTDTHGVAQCTTCGAPYQVLFYENDKRVEREPEMMLTAEGANEARRFHAETGARLSAVGMHLSFPGGYDVARIGDIEAWNAFRRAGTAPHGEGG